MSFQSPAPSSNGGRLYADGFLSHAELVIYDSNARQFLPFLSGISAGDLSFSRDGKWVAYVSYPDGSLWRSRTDGSERLQLTYPPIVAALTRWSPDGRRILFTDFRLGAPAKMLLISTEGGTPEEVLPGNEPQLGESWSPDGKQIAFARFPWIPGADIRVLDVDSRRVTVIMLFDFRTREWAEWISEQNNLGYPTWSVDGRYLYFDSAETSTYRRVRLGENHSEMVVDLKDLHRYSGPVGVWSGLTPDGRPLFARDISTDEIYALDMELP
jgi:Tol biopolymer transport system component